MVGVPYSFDILVFLFVANRFRVEQGGDVLDVAFVAHASDPGIVDQEIQENFKSRYRSLIHNLGIQATQMLSCIGNIHFFDNRKMFVDYFNGIKKQVTVFPEFYNPVVPLYKIKHNQADFFCYRHLIGEINAEKILNLRAPADAVTFAQRWIEQNTEDKPTITITLRQLETEKSKNTNLSVFQDVIRDFSDKEIMFVIIPDYETAYTNCPIEGDNVVVCNEAVLSLSFRAAIYESVSFNVFSNNGPAAIGPLSRIVKYIVINPIRDEPSSRMESIAHSNGLKENGSYWGANQYQRLIWKPETREIITEEITRMYNDLQDSGQLISE